MLREFRFITFGVPLLLFNRLSTEGCCDPEAIGDANPAGTAVTDDDEDTDDADDDAVEDEEDDEDDEEDDAATELLADRSIFAVADGRLIDGGGRELELVSGSPPLLLAALLSC